MLYFTIFCMSVGLLNPTMFCPHSTLNCTSSHIFTRVYTGAATTVPVLLRAVKHRHFKVNKPAEQKARRTSQKHGILVIAQLKIAAHPVLIVYKRRVPVFVCFKRSCAGEKWRDLRQLMMEARYSENITMFLKANKKHINGLEK